MVFPDMLAPATFIIKSGASQKDEDEEKSFQWAVRRVVHLVAPFFHFLPNFSQVPQTDYFLLCTQHIVLILTCISPLSTGFDLALCIILKAESMLYPHSLHLEDPWCTVGAW